MFNQIYDILSTFLFNGDMSTFAYSELICQGISGILCSVLVLLPFIIVWRFIRVFL
jgi:Fe2+ transport system protein B